MDNSSKVILDLCRGTGSWSKPYRDAGYDVRVVTMPENDVRTYEPPTNVYGVLTAPPCTHFSIAANRLWKEKDADGRTFEDISILTACLMIIAKARPKFWVVENPVGRMRRLLGDPDLTFNPFDFGDPYKKKTLLWGRFKRPSKRSVPIVKSEVGHNRGWMFKLGGSSAKTKELRSITPPGFAEAFYRANP